MYKPLLKAFVIVLLFILFCWPDSFARVNSASKDALNTTETAKAVEDLQSKVFAQNYALKKNAKSITIKILSGTGDLNKAKAMAKRLRYMGYDIAAVDLAPRNNFTSNTIYYAENARNQAEELAADLESTHPVVKSLSWSSQFDIILVVTEIPEKKREKKAAPKTDGLHIKVLSGDGNISAAKSIARQLKKRGHDQVSVDYAPRSDFRKNIVYYSKAAKNQAEELAAILGDPRPTYKPLTWKSKYDVILVAVSGEKMVEEKISMEELLRSNQKKEILALNEKSRTLISEAHESFTQENFALAEEKYKSAHRLMNKIEDRCKHSQKEASEAAQTMPEGSAAPQPDLTEVKFQVLSKNVDLKPAKKTAKLIKKLGFDLQPVDYALRSDLTNNTLYYHPSYEKLAEEVAFALPEDPYLKPIRWYSTYDLILVTGEPAKRGRAAWLLEKWRTEEKSLKHKIDGLLTQANSLVKAEEYGQARGKYAEAAELAKRAEKISEKSIHQAKKLALEEALEQSEELKEMAKVSEKTILSLNEAIKIAVANNATIKEAEEKLNSAIEEKKIARADFFPKGSAEYTYTKLNEQPSAAFVLPPNPFLPAGGNLSFTVGNQETYEWNASLTQPLFAGFAIVSQYQMKELGIKIAEIEKEMAMMNLVRDVKKGYFNLLLAKAAVKVADEAVNNLKSHENDAEQYYKQGMIPYNDLLKSKVALAHVVQQREKALSAVKITKSVLNTLLDFDVNREIDVEGLQNIPPVSFQLADLLHEAVENRPELKMLHLAVKSLDQGIRLVKSAYYPKVAMVGYYEQTGENPWATKNDYGSIYNRALILKAQWDFFEGGKTRSNVAKYQYDKKALMKQYEYVENGIQLEVKKAFSDLQVSDKNIITSQKSLTQAKENWRITDLQYKEQIATSTDVLDARTELTQAESNYYSALYGYMVALADLERAVGRKHMILEESPVLE